MTVPVDPATATTAAQVGMEAAKASANVLPSTISTVEAILPDKVQRERKQRLALIKQRLAAGMTPDPAIFTRMKGEVAAEEAAGLGSIANKVRGVAGHNPQAEATRRQLRKEQRQKALAAKSDIRQKEVDAMAKGAAEVGALEGTIAAHDQQKFQQAMTGLTGMAGGLSDTPTTLEDVGEARKAQLASADVSQMDADAAARVAAAKKRQGIA